LRGEGRRSEHGEGRMVEREEEEECKGGGEDVR